MNRNYTGQKKIMGAGLGGRAWSEQLGLYFLLLISSQRTISKTLDVSFQEICRTCSVSASSLPLFMGKAA